MYIPADECVFDEAFPANIQKSAGGKRNQRKQRRKSIRAAVEVRAKLGFLDLIP